MGTLHYDAGDLYRETGEVLYNGNLFGRISINNQYKLPTTVTIDKLSAVKSKILSYIEKIKENQMKTY